VNFASSSYDQTYYFDGALEGGTLEGACQKKEIKKFQQ